MGGPHVTFITEEALNEGADYIFRNEADESFPNFINWFEDTKSLNDLFKINGISFKYGRDKYTITSFGKVIINDYYYCHISRLQKNVVDEIYNELEKMYSQELDELQRISQMSKEEARDTLMQEVEKEARSDMARIMRQVEAEAREEGEA